MWVTLWPKNRKLERCSYRSSSSPSVQTLHSLRGSWSWLSLRNYTTTQTKPTPTQTKATCWHWTCTTVGPNNQVSFRSPSPFRDVYSQVCTHLRTSYNSWWNRQKTRRNKYFSVGKQCRWLLELIDMLKEFQLFSPFPFILYTTDINWHLPFTSNCFPGGASGKENLPANAEDRRDTGSIPGSGRSPGEGHGNSLQYSCLEIPMDRGAWQTTDSLCWAMSDSWSPKKI